MRQVVDLGMILVGAVFIVMAGSLLAEPDKGLGSVMFWSILGGGLIWGGTR